MDNDIEFLKAKIADERKENLKTWLFYGVFFAFVIGVSFILTIWLTNRQESVTNIEKVGTLLEASFSDGFSESTSVLTSKGRFKTEGTFNIIVGHPAEIRTYLNRDRRLCDQVTNRCKNLIE